MLNRLTLKYDTLDNWSGFLQTNSYSPICKIVAKNGEGKFNPFILAALSPFLKELLSSVPPYIEGCIILPEIEFTEVSQFLESLFSPNAIITVTQSLVKTLGINLDNFKLLEEGLDVRSFGNEWINSDCNQSLNYNSFSSNVTMLNQGEVAGEYTLIKNEYIKTDNLEAENTSRMKTSKLNLKYPNNHKTLHEQIQSHNDLDRYTPENRNFDNGTTLNKDYKQNSFLVDKSCENTQMKDDDFRINVNSGKGNTIKINVDDLYKTWDSIVDDEGSKLQLRNANGKTINNVLGKYLVKTENSGLEKITQTVGKIDEYSNCEFCYKAYPSKLALKDHQKECDPVNTVNPARTEKLGLKFEYKTDVKSKYFARKDGRIQCGDEKCIKTFKSLYEAYGHYEGVHIAQLSYPCDQCTKIFKSRKILIGHVKDQHNAQQGGKVTCDVCGGSYLTIKSLSHHKKNYHPKIAKTFFCSYCPRMFKTKQHIREHENTHTGSRKVTCEICGKKVYSKAGLVNHIKNKHEKIKIQSTETSGVRNYKKMLTSMRAYKNDLSLVKFKKQGGEFVCKESNCLKSFVTHQRAIGHHEKIHIGLPVYPCDQCDKSLTSWMGWRSHKWRDHTKGLEPTVKCEYCGKDYISEARKNEHIGKYHKKGKQLLVPLEQGFL